MKPSCDTVAVFQGGGASARIELGEAITGDEKGAACAWSRSLKASVEIKLITRA